NMLSLSQKTSNLKNIINKPMQNDIFFNFLCCYYYPLITFIHFYYIIDGFSLLENKFVCDSTTYE
ncbi:MAG TPA: hypothetical protein VKR58_10305, partial [Aquella sp.]|nr:hypothetical protein [Aquella sp.]